MTTDGLLSAQVVLRPASGVTPAEPVTAENLAAYLPSPEAADRARDWFRQQGFEVGPLVGTSFAVSGLRSLFERVFGTTLDVTPRTVRTSGGGLELPVEGLPVEVVEVVSAVGFSPPPDFGPGNP